ncbi:dimethylargininase [Luethyella okanaganae]|uniref:Dimethylargininase n=1 Tax=Luethyella okanaganae TaxID=69372 RepID=A0ABW1VG92_9MICO
MTTPVPAASAPTIRTGRQGRVVLAAAVSAFVVALVSYLVTVLAYFIGNGHQAQTIAQVANYFLLSTIIAFVLLTVFNLLGATRGWLPALAGGLGGGVFAALVGTTVTVASSGTAFTPDVVAYVLSSLLSLNLVFVLAVALVELTLGRRVFARVIAFRNIGRGSGERRVALVRIPASNLADGEVTHIERSTIDPELADEQWDRYCAALVAEGWETVEVPAAPELADSVFIEDAVVMFGDLAVITRPGAEARSKETVGAEQAVRELGGLTIRRIEQPGTLDGGDVLKVGATVYVGRSSRTNSEGVRQLRTLLAPLGYTVIAVPVSKALHLKSAVTALPDGTIIGYEPIIDDPSMFDRFLPMPEEGGAHVVVLGPDTVLMAASAPQSAALVADLGYRVVVVDISEFEKLEGCVTCLSVRVR